MANQKKGAAPGESDGRNASVGGGVADPAGLGHGICGGWRRSVDAGGRLKNHRTLLFGWMRRATGADGAAPSRREPSGCPLEVASPRPRRDPRSRLRPPNRRLQMPPRCLGSDGGRRSVDAGGRSRNHGARPFGWMRRATGADGAAPSSGIRPWISPPHGFQLESISLN